MRVRQGLRVVFNGGRGRGGLALVAALGCGAAAANGCSVEPTTKSGPPPSSQVGSANPGGGDNGTPASGGSVISSGAPEVGQTGGSGQSTPFTSTPFQPFFGPLVTASEPPPPISGGTLLVTQDGKSAVAADPDRDAVYVVDTGSMKLVSTIALHSGDEPGRLVQDGAGRVHVALRGSGALATIDIAGGTVTARRQACPAPRGVAWDSSSDLVWVACATGELVALPASGGAVTRSLVLERDLRDVIAAGDGTLSVTKFRSAEVLRVAVDGTVTRRDALPSPATSFAPHVAWRTLAGVSGTLVSVHQAESTTSLSTTVQGGYGSVGCGGLGFAPPPPPPPPAPVDFDAGAAGDDASAVPSFPPPVFPTGCLGPESGAVIGCLTVLDSDGTAKVNTSFQGTLPVDVAVSQDGSAIAAVAAGNSFVSSLNNVFYFDQQGAHPGWTHQTGSGPAIAVAFGPNNAVLVQTREPAQLQVLSSTEGSVVASISLSASSRGDSGHDIFHTQAGGGIACASCHPEGGDDGHVWILDGKHRRTPSLRGTIAGTAPYHWPGDEANLTVLVNDVYTKRMSGVALSAPQMTAVQSWVTSVPAPPMPTWVDASAAQRGKAIFNRSAVGCINCHNGPKFTNNQTVDVGTGGSFQVPPLVGVGWRTPLLHDGCAATIADRFAACSPETGGHGTINSLSAQDISDLTAYLETL